MNPGKRPGSQKIVLYCLGLRKQNPGLREVDLVGIQSYER